MRYGHGNGELIEGQRNKERDKGGRGCKGGYTRPPPPLSRREKRMPDIPGKRSLRVCFSAPDVLKNPESAQILLLLSPLPRVPCVSRRVPSDLTHLYTPQTGVYSVSLVLCTSLKHTQILATGDIIGRSPQRPCFRNGSLR